MARPRTLQLVLEQKLYELLPDCTAKTKLEASGVEVVDGHLLIVLDNLPQLARIPFTREPLGFEAGTFVGRLSSTGFEDLTCDRRRNRLLLLREAVRQHDGFQAELEEWDDSFDSLGAARLDFTFEDANKGFEGLAWMPNGEDDQVLAICEGNHCCGGKKGRTPGGGRIQVFKRGRGVWVHHHELALPDDLPFEDYSGLTVSDDRVAVVSQASSMVWVGRLGDDRQSFRGSGQLYEFPRDESGRKVYSTVEGITWLGANQIVVVSDQRKKDDPPPAGEKDQSVHIFDLP